MTRGEALSTLLLLAVVVGIAALLYWYWAPALPVGPGSSPELADGGPPSPQTEARADKANGAGNKAIVTATGTAQPCWLRSARRASVLPSCSGSRSSRRGSERRWASQWSTN